MSLKGQRYGLWLILRDIAAGGQERRVLCECACGTRALLRVTHLQGGKTRACRTCARKAVWAERKARAGVS